MTSWTSLGGEFDSSVSVVSWNSSSNRIDVFAWGTDYSIQHNFWNGTWSGWETLGGGGNTFAWPPAVVSWGPDRIDVFAVAYTDSSFSHIAYNGTAWTAWESFGGIFAGGPTAVSWGVNRIDLFVIGDANSAFWATYNGISVSTFEKIGGTLVTPPVAVSWGPNRLDLFALGVDHDIWHNSWDATSNSWANWASIGGGPFTSAPTAVSSAPETIDIFALGQNHTVWHGSLSSQGQGKWESLNMTSNSNVGVCSWAPGQLDVFIVGVDSAIWYESWNGSSWSGWNSLGGEFELSIRGLCFSANSIDLFGLGMDGAVSSAAVVAPTGMFVIRAVIDMQHRRRVLLRSRVHRPACRLHTGVYPLMSLVI